jgi:NAD(P)-dependent dehydrogenase (short-subunit alcohol dehydrogenase family)
VTRILITGSAEGLGRAAATTLLGDGHQVVVHARDTNRAAALTDLVDRGAALVVGDLASAAAHPIASFHGRVNGSARTSQPPARCCLSVSALRIKARNSL